MVVYAEVKGFSLADGRSYDELVKNPIEEDIKDDNYVFTSDCVDLNLTVGLRETKGEQYYVVVIYPFSRAAEVGVGFPRGVYFVEELTGKAVKEAMRDIFTKINNIWGNNWDEIRLRLGWFCWDEYENMFNKKTPFLKEDGTVDYEPNKYWIGPGSPNYDENDWIIWRQLL